MENAPRDVGRTVERDLVREDATLHASNDTHIPGDDIAFYVSFGADNKAIGIDLSKDVALNMELALRIKDALDRQRSSKMGRRQLRILAAKRRPNERAALRDGHNIPSSRLIPRRSDTDAHRCRSASQSSWQL